MKNDTRKNYIFSIAFFTLTFFNLFVPNTSAQSIILLALVVVSAIISKFYIKGKNINNLNKKTVAILVGVLSIIYVAILYLLGFVYSFYKNPIAFGLTSFFKRVLPYLVLVICSEIIRKVCITREKKIPIFFTTMGLILAEITIHLGTYSLINFQEILTLVGYVIFSSISTNLLMNYMIKRYGVIPNILYRVITTVYVYTFPILPDVYLFFQSVYKIIYPYIIYLILDNSFEMNVFRKAKDEKRVNIIFIIFGILVIIGFVMLISCEFRYGLMAIGSSSMATSINKGDAIIYEEYESQNLQIGDIIVFNKNNVKTIHRIVEIQKKKNEIIYYTKGDNNQNIDDGFVTADDIIGVCKFRIIYIGWPTVLLSEFITNIGMA